jgi:hypothetical protein
VQGVCDGNGSVKLPSELLVRTQEDLCVSQSAKPDQGLNRERNRWSEDRRLRPTGKVQFQERLKMRVRSRCVAEREFEQAERRAESRR